MFRSKNEVSAIFVWFFFLFIIHSSHIKGMTKQGEGIGECISPSGSDLVEILKKEQSKKKQTEDNFSSNFVRRRGAVQ